MLSFPCLKRSNKQEIDVKIWLAIVVGISFAAQTAHAQTTKTTVLGWTGTGQEIVTRTETFGEVMVEDVAKEYWFETTQTLRMRDGGVIQTYRHGEPSGAADKVAAWAEAKDASQAAKYLENAGLVEAVESSITPDGKRALSTVSRVRYENGDQGFRCTTDSRVLLHDQATSQVWVVLEASKTGGAAPTQVEASCPKVSFQTWWHPDGSRWLVQQTTDRESRWIPGAVSRVDEFATAPFRVADFAAQTLTSSVPEGPLKSAWLLALSGDAGRALTKLAEDTSSDIEKFVLKALLLALSGDEAAAKAILKDITKLAKTPAAQGMLGAVHHALGDTKAATRLFNTAIKKAESYQELARLGALLTLVDLDLANQLFIHALSHPKAAEGDTAVLYAALIQGLLEVGENEAAQDLLQKVDRESGVYTLLQARLDLMTGREQAAKAIVDEVLFSAPGRCMAYGLAAKMAVLSGDTAEALEQYRAAAICAPADLEARFFVADLEARRGDIEASRRAVSAFLGAATPRKNDLIRDARRKVMTAAHVRYDRDGVVLLNVSCRSGLCQGQVFNTQAETATQVTVAAFSGDKTPAVVGRAVLEEVPGRSARPFMVRADGIPATVTVGRDDAELQINMTAPTP